MSKLHQISQRDQLQLVNGWLEQRLPDTFWLFNYTRAVLEGRWAGESIYTLGWPSIRAVVTGGMEPGHPAPDYYRKRCHGFMYATEEEDIDFLLNHEKVVDWSKPFVKRCLPERIARDLEKHAKDLGFEEKCHPFMTYAFHAKPEDIQKRPVPEGYRIRAVRPDPTDIDYCVSTWKLASPSCAQGVKACVEQFPSVCLVDAEDRIVSFETVTEYGTLGLLHTREEHRGRGFAKVVTSHLAEEFRELNWDLYAFVMVGNDISHSFHQSMGFQCLDEKFGCFRYDPKMSGSSQ